ncbi:MAG TPA: hypothetical protein VF723_15775 [Pyrinomonadaceae bacterium]|jgi:hypothetical protein
MHTSRISISSLLAAAMSVYACLLLPDGAAKARLAPVFNQAQGSEFAPDAAVRDAAQSETRTAGDEARETQPLLAFLKWVSSLQAHGQLDLESPFEILVEGDRAPDGLINNLEVTQKSGDVRLKELGGDFTRTLGESRLLASSGETAAAESRHLRLTISSDKALVAANAFYETESTRRAMEMSRGYGTLIRMAVISKHGDEQLIYKNLTAAANGRDFVLQFSMPRETFCALLSKYLSSH